MDRAVDLLVQWTRERLDCIEGARVDVIRLAQRTPLVFIDLPGDSGTPVLVYGHLDKQPPMSGWATGRAAWTPVIEGDRLYGRGGADDGYAIFSAITAILALREQGLAHPRCMILIEACEESSSSDLPHYIAHLSPRIGVPALIVALDAGCGDYDRLWMTTSLRGQVAGRLSVRVLDEGVHSGDAAGMVPSSFRIARQLLSRLEDAVSGEIIAPQFHALIPPERRAQAAEAASTLGAGLHAFPFPPGMTPVNNDLTELALNRSWRPQLTITGIDGLPSVAHAAAVMMPSTTLKISLRLPPTLDAAVAGDLLKALLESDPPYGCEVAFALDFATDGWHAPTVATWLEASLDHASTRAFGSAAALIGGGGGIPFLALLGERFPQAQFVVTGVLGPQSNAHGPNEFLHLPTAKRITAVLALVLRDALTHAQAPAVGVSLPIPA
jgi:acetylornithine deacetylase/succinyl-diaminopimelate desuccinylase-like protein